MQLFVHKVIWMKLSNAIAISNVAKAKSQFYARKFKYWKQFLRENLHQKSSFGILQVQFMKCKTASGPKQLSKLGLRNAFMHLLTKKVTRE